MRPLRFAVCNEVFGDIPFAESCRAIKQIGYSGIEIAPFTLADNPVTLTTDDRERIRRQIIERGLSFTGLHWLLMSPKGLHATTPDKAIRRATWDFVAGLIDLCSDLTDGRAGANSVMVFGSPQQRSATSGAAPQEAVEILKDELTRIAPHAAERGVVLLLEPLSRSQTNVINTMAEAVEIVKEIDHPAIATMFDVHNAIDEIPSHLELLGEYLPWIKHVHVNEMDGREPGTGEYDFGRLLSFLEKTTYRGWISLEVFDFSRDGREIAKAGFDHLVHAITSY